MVSDNTALGDRMKRYEHTTRVLCPPRTYSLLRVDIVAAHSYLRQAERPFDAGFILDMNHVAEELCREITGTVFAFTQSDEISILFYDFAGLNTQPWRGGVMAKQLSVAAGLASAALTRVRPDGRPVFFDSRIWHMSDPVEVANYFVWRQRDTVKNSIQMVARAHFSHAEIQGLHGDQLQEKLFQEKGINWGALPDGRKRGRITVKDKESLGGESLEERFTWRTFDAPHFAALPGLWLPRTIPALPSFDDE